MPQYKCNESVIALPHNNTVDGSGKNNSCVPWTIELVVGQDKNPGAQAVGHFHSIKEMLWLRLGIVKAHWCLCPWEGLSK